MNDTINAALKAVLDSLQAGISFAKAEIPLLLKEKLAYDFYSNAAEVAFFLLIAIGFTVAFVKFLKFDRERNAFKDYHKEPVGSVGTAVAGSLWWILTLIVLFNDGGNMLKIHLAPRLYLMEWLVTLVKK